MYAIIKTGGKQYKVCEGDVIYIEKLEAENGSEVVFDEVYAVGEGDKLNVGSPFVAGAKVTATVEKSARGKKITVFTYRSKKNSKRKMGHRQPYTKVTINKING